MYGSLHSHRPLSLPDASLCIVARCFYQVSGNQANLSASFGNNITKNSATLWQSDYNSIAANDATLINADLNVVVGNDGAAWAKKDCLSIPMTHARFYGVAVLITDAQNNTVVANQVRCSDA